MAAIEEPSLKEFAEARSLVRDMSSSGMKISPVSGVDMHRIVAGVALAFEKHDASFEGEARDFSDFSIDNTRLSYATARFLKSYETDPSRFAPSDGYSTTQKIMTTIASDVKLQADASESYNEGKKFAEQTFSDEKVAKKVASAFSDLEHEASGVFTGISPERQAGIASIIANGLNLGTEMRQGIARISNVIDGMARDDISEKREMDRRLADFNEIENPTPLFQRQTAEDRAIAFDILDGKHEPRTKAEIGATAFARSNHDFTREIASFAIAQSLADHDRGGYLSKPKSSASIAIKTEALAQVYTDRQAAFYMDPNIESPWLVAPVHMKNEQQVSIFHRANASDFSSDLRNVELAVKSAEVEAEADKSKLLDRTVTFENVSESHRNFVHHDGYLLPGDKVRLDPNRKIENIGDDEYEGRLGFGPLEISRTIITGKSTASDDGIEGNGYFYYIPSYELKGHEGRFHAEKFQHENGEDHVLAALIHHENKFWLVPGETDSEGFFPTKTAREVDFRLFPETSSLSDDIKKEGVLGEFAIINKSFGDTKGAVDLVAIPWMSSLSDSELMSVKSSVNIRIENDKSEVSIEAVMPEKSPTSSKSAAFAALSSGVSR